MQRNYKSIIQLQKWSDTTIFSKYQIWDPLETPLDFDEIDSLIEITPIRETFVLFT